MNKKIIAIVSIAILTIVFCTQFIDSADAICAREMNGVSLICRGMTMAAIVSKGTVLIRLPYSEFLYGISTGGKEYGR